MRTIALLSILLVGVLSVSFTYGFAFQVPSAGRTRTVVVSNCHDRGYPTSRSHAHTIYASSEESQPSSDDDNTSNTNNSLLVTEYKVASAVYFATAGLILAQNGFLKPEVVYIASGPFLGGAIQYILMGAAFNSRLSSDTYKRLNLFATEYAVYSVFMVLTFLIKAIVEKVKMPSTPYLLFGLSGLLASIPSIKGWFKGKDGEKSVFKEILGGTKDSVKGLVSLKNLNAAVYLAGTLFVATSKVTKVVEIVYEFKNDSALAQIATRVARMAKLSLFAAVLYTLKDAADRRRLEGTTFIELNFISSVMFVSMAANWFKGTLELPVVGASLLSLFTAINGIISLVRKRSKK